MTPTPIPPRPGQGAGAARLAEILRVDHAGELAAVAIYRGQRAVLEQARGQERLTRQLAEMEAHEAVHLARFDALLTERGVRPTAMVPLWRLAGFVLGAGTALLGDKAAHACTEAVETVIEEHYAGQVAELEGRDPALAAELAGFREEELAHRDLAREEGAAQAPAYGLLTAVIRAGCKAAIKISEKV
jgi:ubiquinone biosynthesis monooxygenase Coq7